MTTNTTHMPPSEYLKQGLLDPQGRIRSGINGERSLGLAFLLKEEGASSSQVQAWRESIGAAMEALLPQNTPLSVAEFDDGAKAALEAVSAEIGAQSGRIAEVLDTAAPHLRTWTCFAHLMDHLERTNAQLAWIEAARTDES